MTQKAQYVKVQLYYINNSSHYNYLIWDFTHTCMLNNLLLMCDFLSLCKIWTSPLCVMGFFHHLCIIHELLYICHWWESHVNPTPPHPTHPHPHAHLWELCTSMPSKPYVTPLFNTISNTLLLGFFSRSLVICFMGLPCAIHTQWRL